MPESDFHADLRETRFALFQGAPFDDVVNIDRFSHADHVSVNLLLDEAYKFFRNEISPVDAPGDRQGCRYENGSVVTPQGYRDAYRAIGDAGYLQLTSPESDGGMGMPYLVSMVLTEMQTGACCSLSLCLGLTDAAATMLSAYGSADLKKAYLGKLRSGLWQGTMCLTEAHAGSALADIKTHATPSGDHWKLKGTKVFISAGDHDMAENHIHFVLARTPNAPKGIKGISLFLVPKFRLTSDGSVGERNDVTCTGIEHKMGIHGSPTCTMQFGESEDCRGYLVGEEGQGMVQMFRMMNHARLGVGLQGLALASQAYCYALEYANERVQGVDIENVRDVDAERVAIANHPNVRQKLLWCKATVEGCRALLYTTAAFADISMHHAEDSVRETFGGLLEFLTPLCKAYCSDQGFEVTRLAMQTMGGYGYISEYPVERFMRDIKIASIYEGTNGIQALDLIGRKLPAKNGAYFRELSARIDAFVSENKDHTILKEEVAELAQERDRWTTVTMLLGSKGMSGDRRYPVLCANSYLKMTGHVVCAWLLLKQAVVAQRELLSLYAAHDADSDAKRDAMHRENESARFLFNKVETARYFLYNILVENRSIATQIESDDRSALRYVTTEAV